MKELYIFNVKEEFYKLYKEHPSELYNIYKRIYFMNKSDKEYGYNLFCQISNFLDKKEINKILMSKYKDKIMYSYNDNEHIINNILESEISILKVNHSNLKIESNIEYPSFIKDIKKLEGNFLICDFKGQDFYFINKSKKIKEISK